MENFPNEITYTILDGIPLLCGFRQHIHRVSMTFNCLWNNIIVDRTHTFKDKQMVSTILKYVEAVQQNKLRCVIAGLYANIKLNNWFGRSRLFVAYHRYGSHVYNLQKISKMKQFKIKDIIEIRKSMDQQPII